LRISGPELDALAYQAAPDAMLAITAKIGQFQGESGFTTGAYKFVIFEVSAKTGRHFGGTRACGWTPRTGKFSSRWWSTRFRWMIAGIAALDAYGSGSLVLRAGNDGFRARPLWHRPSYCPVASRGMVGFHDHPPGSRPLDRSRDLKGEAPALAGWAGRGRPRHHRPDGPGWRLFAVPALSEAWSP
jgi:hypothetical protein